MMTLLYTIFLSQIDLTTKTSLVSQGMSFSKIFSKILFHHPKKCVEKSKFLMKFAKTIWRLVNRMKRKKKMKPPNTPIQKNITEPTQRQRPRNNGFTDARHRPYRANPQSSRNFSHPPRRPQSFPSREWGATDLGTFHFDTFTHFTADSISRPRKRSSFAQRNTLRRSASLRPTSSFPASMTDFGSKEDARELKIALSRQSVRIE